MLNGKKIVVVMPAYNAAKTLRATYQEIPLTIVDDVILVDDKSDDNTAALAQELGISTIIHSQNLGYGGNQKTCYQAALAKGADIVIMLHPDYQYTPKLILPMAALIAEGLFDCVLGSRILGTGAIKGGMPLYKYFANRLLTLFQNILLGHKLSEYHTGYRAFSKEILQTLPLEANSNDFLFDNQMLAQIIFARFSIGEITCPTLYFEDASSISPARAAKYGLGVLATSIEYRAQLLNLVTSPRFSPLCHRRLAR
ncbi:MAG: glycosyltransferase family 2 protein [Proteobacteria bacterium]|nr:glycosyltransferase family 2 protein [Pseudomonadota bacterium]MBU1648810.1 glycosyltransferase family 2 protein [Pseudomonadota bacterium]